MSGTLTPMAPDSVAALAALDHFGAAAGLRPGTRHGYHTVAVRFLRWIEPQGIGLSQVTSQVVEHFLASLTIAPTSRSAYRTGLRHFLDALDSRALMEANPVADGRPGPARPAIDWEEMGSWAEQFGSFTPIEKQATVDAAFFALLFHDIHLFTEGQGGACANVDLCEEILQRGERCGIVPLDDNGVTRSAGTPRRP